MIKKRWVAAATLAATAWAAPAASAETIYGLTDGNSLVTFDSATPGTTSTPIPLMGLGTGETIEGIDVRPATLQLYALSSTGRFLRIDPVTGATTAIGVAQTVTATEDYDLDFNPTVDRLRIVSSSEQNLRLNPNTGAAATVDTPLTPAGNVTGAAYTNNAPASSAADGADADSLPDAPTTQLLDIDTGTDQLFTQTPPNDGVLASPRPLGVDLVGDVGFDISTTSTTLTGVPDANTAYVVGRTTDTLDRLYTLNPTSGALTAVGEVGGASKVKDIAVAAPVPQVAVLYTPAVAGQAQQIVNYRADRPSVASAPVTVSGLQGAERLIGLDRRPVGGAIFGVTDASRVYTINLSTGLATLLPSSTPFTPNLVGDLGIDFNPVADTGGASSLRLVTDSDQNLAVNAITGVATNQTALAFAAAPDANAGTNPNVTAAAYTNPTQGATTTSLFDIDTGVDDLVNQGGQVTPGAFAGGQLNTIGDLGVAVEDGNGLDIVQRFNQQFAALLPSAAASVPTLYGVNVASTAPPATTPPTPLGPANGGAVSIGALAVPTALTGATIAGMTVVQDNILPPAPTPPYTIPTPTPTYTVPTPVPTVIPNPPQGKKKPRITAKARPKRDKRKPFVFRVSGQLKRPNGVSKNAGCKGTVVIKAKKGSKTLANKRTGIKSTCKYKARVKLNTKKAGKRGTVKFKVQFKGNNRLKQAKATAKAKYGKKK